MKDSSLENLKNCLCQKLGSLPSRDECERLQADIDAADSGIERIIDKYIEKLNSGEAPDVTEISQTDLAEYIHFYGKRKLGDELAPDNIDAATFKATVEDSDDLYPFEAERKYIAEHNGHEN